MADLQRTFNDLIRFEIELWNALDARLRGDFALTMSQFEHLQVIEGTQSCRAYDIAQALSITEGATSKIVARIESAGYCRRRSNPRDGRSSIIALTPTGKRLVAKARAVFSEELETWFTSALSPRALEQFSTALATLRSHAALTTSTERRSR